VNRSLLLREWGAVTFVVTVFLGIVIVPIALVVGNHPPPPSALVVSPSPTASGPASAARSASPSSTP
jgi:hypothetical protein